MRPLRKAHPRELVAPASLVLATLLLAVGLSLPLIHVEKLLFWENDYSVVTGLFGLAEDGQWFLAGVVFFWSVVFPIGKLLVLGWLWFARTDAERRGAALRRLETLGKWSMLDVYIVAVLVVAVKLGPLAEIRVEPGLYAFGAAVLLSMLAGARIRALARRSRA